MQWVDVGARVTRCGDVGTSTGWWAPWLLCFCWTYCSVWDPRCFGVRSVMNFPVGRVWGTLAWAQTIQEEICLGIKPPSACWATNNWSSEDCMFIVCPSEHKICSMNINHVWFYSVHFRGFLFVLVWRFVILRGSNVLCVMKDDTFNTVPRWCGKSIFFGNISWI